MKPPTAAERAAHTREVAAVKASLLIADDGRACLHDSYALRRATPALEPGPSRVQPDDPVIGVTTSSEAGEW